MISICKGTIKFNLEQVRRPKGGGNSEQERVGWSLPSPGHFTPGKDWVPLV